MKTAPAPCRRACRQLCPALTPSASASGDASTTTPRAKLPDATTTGRSYKETLEEQLVNLKLDESKLLSHGFGEAHPYVQSVRDRMKTVRGLSSAGRGTPSREKESVEELLGCPTPEEIDSSSDPKRVLGDVTSAMI